MYEYECVSYSLENLLLQTGQTTVDLPVSLEVDVISKVAYRKCNWSRG